MGIRAQSLILSLGVFVDEGLESPSAGIGV